VNNYDICDHTSQQNPPKYILPNFYLSHQASTFCRDHFLQQLSTTHSNGMGGRVEPC